MSARVERLLIFDIDGTLLLNGPVVREVFALAFEETCGVAPRLDGVHFAGMTDRGIFRRLLERGGIEGAFEPLFARFAEIFPRRLTEPYATAEGPRLMPGVPALLEELSRRPGVGMVVGSGNLAATARIKLGRFQLERYFGGGAYGSEHEHRDALFRAALEDGRRRLGYRGPAAHTWVIGDTLADVEAARAVGMKMLAVATGPKPADDLRVAGATAWVEDLSATRTVLDLLEFGD